VSVTFQKLSTRVLLEIEEDPNFPTLSSNQILLLLTRSFDQIGTALSHGEDVYLEGFGRFYPDCKPPRKVKSGLTSEIHTTKHKVFVRFNPFKTLNRRVQVFLGRLGVGIDVEESDV
jgi:nucleoid DNA-binding protein